MKLNLITVSLATLVAAGAFPAHAGPQAHVVCGYHHTLGDDAIMMFGKANQAMWHDFFGNAHTDAVSTYQTLRAQPDTTCDNKADSSAYWAPSMKLPDGDIGIAFPNCWDGVNLKPTHSHNNAIYADHGKCSADYPVKIPTVNMNIAWVLPQISSLDTSKVELSMDPVMHGETREERWGSLYTAHADFMNGWTEDGAQFMTDLCMNQGLDCGTTVPYAYSKAEENTWVSSEDDKPHASVDTLYVQDDWTNGGRTQHPETLTLVKFKIPPLPANMDASLFKYRIRLFGGKTEANGADQIFFYPTSSDWHVSTVSWNNKPAINYRSDAVLYLDHSHEYRMVDVDKAVRKALAEGKTEISWYIGGDRQGNHYDFTPADSKQSLVLMLTGFKKTPEL